MNFGTMMQFDPLTVENLELTNEIKFLTYLTNGLTDLREIWHIDKLGLRTRPKVKIHYF